MHVNGTSRPCDGSFKVLPIKKDPPCPKCTNNTGRWMQDPCMSCDQDLDLHTGLPKERYDKFFPVPTMEK